MAQRVQPPALHTRRREAPRYLVTWVTRRHEVKEERVRGLPELATLLWEIEDDKGDLLVAVAIYSLDLVSLS